MPRQFKNARLIKHLKVSEAIEKLGISQPTLSAWEGERKSPSLDKLEQMADVYGVTTDYLLGRMETAPSYTESIPPEMLPVLHGNPVWSAEYGWLLVNAIDRCLIRTDGSSLPFADGGKLYRMPPAFSASDIPHSTPLTMDDLLKMACVWVEPISNDSKLRKELRGLYHIKNRFVENEFGNRFYLDTYHAKWLAFVPTEM